MVICYLTSMGWYQNISDQSNKIKAKVQGGTRPLSKDSPTALIYANIVWVFAFMQMTLFNAILPSALRFVTRRLLAIANGDTDESMVSVSLVALMTCLRLAR